MTLSMEDLGAGGRGRLGAAAAWTFPPEPRDIWPAPNRAAAANGKLVRFTSSEPRCSHRNPVDCGGRRGRSINHGPQRKAGEDLLASAELDQRAARRHLRLCYDG